MRQLQRPQIVLPTLSGTGVGAKAQQENQAREADKPGGEKTLPTHWNKADVRGALYAMSGRKCAYCEIPLPENDRGDVEHFRPKNKVAEASHHGGYWWLAYDFENYLLSCSNCNRNLKKSKFPVAQPAEHTTYQTRRDISREPRLLIDPTLDAVEDWLSVDLSDVDFPGMIRENTDRLASNHIAVQKVNTVLEVFKLNRSAQLFRTRSQAIDEMADADAQGDFQAIRKKASRYAPDSLVYKNLITRYDAQLLPTAAEELLWLLEQFEQEYHDFETLLSRFPGDKKLTRYQHEVLWAFAILWKSPPTGTPPSVVEHWLRGRGLQDAVAQYYEAL